MATLPDMEIKGSIEYKGSADLIREVRKVMEMVEPKCRGPHPCADARIIRTDCVELLKQLIKTELGVPNND